jgi:hypothetical protein
MEAFVNRLDRDLSRATNKALRAYILDKATGRCEFYITRKTKKIDDSIRAICEYAEIQMTHIQGDYETNYMPPHKKIWKLVVKPKDPETCQKCFLLECCCEADRLQVLADDERAKADGYKEINGRWTKE